jgi:hypothetical protein
MPAKKNSCGCRRGKNGNCLKKPKSKKTKKTKRKGGRVKKRNHAAMVALVSLLTGGGAGYYAKGKMG